MRVDAKNQPYQRIRIGLTGLAFVFLLVLLGTAISRSGGGDSSAANGTANADAAPNEPLAEIGAAPGQTSGSEENDSAAAKPTGRR